MTYHTGQLTMSTLWLLLPAGVALLLWATVWLRRDSYRRRFQGKRLFWEMWGSTLVLTVFLFALFYGYLFWRPFYAVTVQPGGEWVLTYTLPEREVRFPPDAIDTVTLEPEKLFPARHKGHRQFVTITLTDGRTFTSVPMGPATAPVFMARLQHHLSLSPSK